MILPSMLTLRGADIILPALSTAHSHAFQRAMRGTAQRRGEARDDFWSWRGQMYRAATAMTPEHLEVVARVAYTELRAAGVRTVGEFHYLHHQADGTPYAERTLLSDVLIRVAKELGMRISLLRCIYHRAGPGRPAEPGQKRFCDDHLDRALGDVETLLSRYGKDPDVRVGLAPHSVRALPPGWLPEIAAFAAKHDLPLHMHVSEQPREIAECIEETGKRPVELLADQGMLGPRFVAVHATHLAPHEAELLGRAQSYACLCPSTERDLGDGLCDVAALRNAGALLCTGIDSHVITDPIEELRSIETHERLRTLARITFSPSDRAPAEALWQAGSIHGARAVGFDDAGGTLCIDRGHPTLALCRDEDLLDAIVFSGAGSMVKSVSADP
jgi:formiminoglutamate deiminase